MTDFARIRAFTVHVFTATGAALALLALILATGGHWAGMFFCLGMALVVDGLDGPMARAFEVEKLLPRWSGNTLDLVVDFTTYVFVPAFAIAASGLLPHVLAIPAAIVADMTHVTAGTESVMVGHGFYSRHSQPQRAAARVADRHLVDAAGAVPLP